MSKTVVITGASSGIGKATAIEFAKRGWSIVVAARGREALEASANEIEIAGGRAFVVVADVAIADDVERLARDAVAAFGSVDVWINNASVAEWSFIEQMPPEEMRRVIEVDLLGTMYGCRAILPHFREHGGGTIINVASALADRAIPLLSTYCAAKAGVKAFSDALRMELRATNAKIDVVTVKPSSIDTPFYSNGKSRLGVRPRPVSHVYTPEKAARAIVAAAERPRRDVYVGVMGKLLALGERFNPRLMDWYMLQRNEMFRQQFSDVPDHGESNLYTSPEETGITR